MVYLLLYSIGKYLSNKFLDEKIKFKLLSKILDVSKDHKYIFNKLIVLTKPSLYKITNIDVEIHSVIQHDAVLYYMLCLKSLLHQLNFEPKIIVHDDGSLEKSDMDLLKSHFPNLRICEYEKSTNEVLEQIGRFKSLYINRKNRFNKNWHMLTLLDVPLLARSSKILYLDSDILFYRKPNTLVKWMNDSSDNSILYMGDYVHAGVLSIKEIVKYFGVKPIIKLNMGILCYSRKSLNLTEMNNYFKFLSTVKKNNRLLRDQTYWMLHAARHCGAKLPLNSNYIVSFRSKRSSRTVCMHYTSEIRERIYTDGIQLMIQICKF